MKLLLFGLLLSSTLSAKTFTVVAVKDSFEEAPEFKALMETLKAEGPFAEKKTVVPAEDKPKTLSRGQQMVEEAKARNRAILRAKKAPVEEEKLTALEKWKKEERATLEGWKKEERDQLSAWKREQEIFLGRLKEYKQNTFVIPAKIEKIAEPKILISQVPEVQIIRGAFAQPVRDQRNRATCAAFAGIRAVEIILAQNDQKLDLSEQYLYWASKPKCQTSPCEEKGSWVGNGFSYSKNQSSVDIPSEESCGYEVGPKPANETQLPLPHGCRTGVAKVEAFEEVRSVSDLLTQLKHHTPVVISTKLTENFYLNKGLITLRDVPAKQGQLDAHALGHAYLAVGVIELPEKLKLTEGNFCVVVTNSWGKGWGAGGYSCITENWLLKYRSMNPFMAVTKVSTK